MMGLIGKKLGMTQIYREDGTVVPVTVVSVVPNTVVGLKTMDNAGYNAVQMAHEEQKESRINKPLMGQFKKAKVAPHKHVKEFRTDRANEYKVGMKVNVGSLNVGEKVNVQGVSKGKGFQGVMKKFHFSGGCDSHGNSVSHRAPGSIGQGTYPGRVIKGTKLPAHMGDETKTVKNLEVIGIESEQNIILIKGALPGAQNTTLYIYPHNKDFEGKFLTKDTDDKDAKKEDQSKDKKEDKKEGDAAAA